MTMEEKLLILYAQLVKETARLELYALRAKKDHQAESALLFKAAAASHAAQARRLLMQLRGFIGDTATNLNISIDQEIPTLKQDYEDLGKTAEEEGNKAISTGCDQSMRIEQLNISLAKQLSTDGKITSYHVCDFCGFVATNRTPAQCPICTAQSRRFMEISSQ